MHENSPELACKLSDDMSDTDELNDDDLYYECRSQSSEDSFQSCASAVTLMVQDHCGDVKPNQYRHPHLHEVTVILTRRTRRRQKNMRKRFNRKMRKDLVDTEFKGKLVAMLAVTNELNETNDSTQEAVQTVIPKK